MSEMMKRIESGVKQYHFIEVMGCTGGCVNGGGQPIVSAADQETIDVRKLRANTLYSIDQERKIRNARENPIVNKIYDEFLGLPNGEKAHHLLHTHYMERKIYSNLK
jgi:NADP-reducing hydrogenase subunit HndD